MKPNPFWKKISLHRYFAIKLALFLFLYINPGLFAELQEADHVEAELVSEVQSILLGKPFCVALRLKMDEHWHIYWKNPGDSGLPPKIEWNLPDGSGRNAGWQKGGCSNLPALWMLSEV